MEQRLDKKEYQSVILASLLHDVGKFLNRARGVQRKHPYFSADFVNQDAFKKIVGPQYVDIDLVKILCQRHHEHPQMPEDLQVQAIGDDHTRALAYIVSRADNYSSKERLDEERSTDDFRSARLMSIFSRVDIGRGKPPHYYHELTKLNPLYIFPEYKEILEKDKREYNDLIEEFGKSFSLLHPATFEHLFHGLLSLLEEYLWCVPSDTTQEYSDVSLFDHLSTTSAIAACLYQCHYPDFGENKIKDDKLDKFILLGGDVSGIQKYIFDIHDNNPRRLSKTLRGRSFLLGLISDAVSLKYLQGLHLPLSCRVINAGGRFVILAPKTDWVKTVVEKLTEEIERWFYETFLGRVTMQVDYSVALSGNDFEPPRLGEKLHGLEQALGEAKLRRVQNIIYSSDLTHLKNISKKLSENGPCSFCGTYPAGKISPGEPEENLCDLCDKAQIVGGKLPSAKWIGFGADKEADMEISGISVSLMKRIESPESYFLLERIGHDDSGENPGHIRRFIANYTPRPDKGLLCDHDHQKIKVGCTALCEFCQSPCTLDERKAIRSGALSFQCIATTTLKKNNDGVDHLAVIKGDVDYLGLIFSRGLGDSLSISRFASISRMIHCFFSGWVPEKIREEKGYTYIVYAGGDDFFLIAPWEEGVEFSRDVRDRFMRFTGANPNITLSIGISLMRPKTPVPRAVGEAEIRLEDAKNKGRDRLSLFNTTIEWKQSNILVEFKDFLNLAMDNGDINSAFLYRLLMYHKLFLDSKRGKIEGLKFHSLMAYDVRRNIEKKDKNGNIINRDIIDQLQRLYVVGNIDEPLMANLTIPVFWALYKHRGKERKGKEE